MKIIAFTFLLSISISSFACSCFQEGSFCNHISGSHFPQNGIVCIVESTGNIIEEDFEFGFAEVKIVDLLLGEINPGYGDYLNTDSTLWILGGPGSVCYEGEYIFSNPGDQFVVASSYNTIGYYGNTEYFGYTLYLCSYDVFRYRETMVGPLINDYNFYYYNPNHEPDIITSTDFPDLVNDCIHCKSSLTLPDPHDYPSTYTVNNNISSTATINSNVVYKANNRVTLSSGFSTNAPYNFSVRMDGCKLVKVD